MHLRLARLWRTRNPREHRQRVLAHPVRIVLVAAPHQEPHHFPLEVARQPESEIELVPTESELMLEIEFSLYNTLMLMLNEE